MSVTVSPDQQLVSSRFPRSSRYNPEWVIASSSGGAHSLWMTEWYPRRFETDLCKVERNMGAVFSARCKTYPLRDGQGRDRTATLRGADSRGLLAVGA